MIYTGNFETPERGASHVPLAISGEGTIESSETGLYFDGFELNEGISSYLIIGLVMMLVIGLPVLIVSMGIDMDGEILGRLIFIPILLLHKAGERSTSERPLRFDVPWTHVESVNLNRENHRLEILTKNQRPKGTIHFRPESDVEDVYNQIKDLHTESRP